MFTFCLPNTSTGQHAVTGMRIIGWCMRTYFPSSLVAVWHVRDTREFPNNLTV